MNLPELRAMQARLNKLHPIRFCYRPGAHPRTLYADEYDRLQIELQKHVTLFLQSECAA